MPALTPLFIYVLWQIFLKKITNKIFNKKYLANQNNANKKFDKKIIEAEFEDVSGKTEAQENISNYGTIFSMQNKNFVIMIYITLILAIIAIITMAF